MKLGCRNPVTLPASTGDIIYVWTQRLAMKHGPDEPTYLLVAFEPETFSFASRLMVGLENEEIRSFNERMRQFGERRWNQDRKKRTRVAAAKTAVLRDAGKYLPGLHLQICRMIRSNARFAGIPIQPTRLFHIAKQRHVGYLQDELTDYLKSKEIVERIGKIEDPRVRQFQKCVSNNLVRLTDGHGRNALKEIKTLTGVSDAIKRLERSKRHAIKKRIVTIARIGPVTAARKQTPEPPSFVAP